MNKKLQRLLSCITYVILLLAVDVTVILAVSGAVWFTRMRAIYGDLDGWMDGTPQVGSRANLGAFTTSTFSFSVATICLVSSR